ncbi:serine/threonine-protein kinase [Actinomadura oligospora]|uniref:serine/threonine-protein kinase n=1 Tax=Actinomadura oligospora TaxID=111804 RepID=UPI0004AD939C|nr:serine/threonine-protein kinase [Actinomadura oligospora]
MRLPEELAGRFAVVAELPVQGAESDLLLVRDGGGRELVMKVFRRGFHADRDVWAKLPALGSPHVVRILETGNAGGRDYEVAEYAEHGNLRTVMDRGPLDTPDIARIVEQLAEGIRALHDAGIVHRDLKPENVLVTALDPVRTAITDFGLSRVLEQSVVFASSSRTLAYAAPESLSGQVSPARDWWSLGMVVREMATGRPPFGGLSETVVVDHLATRPMPVEDVEDPRVRLLVRGLLTRDPRRRWSSAQVSAWLAGESPDVADERERSAPVHGPPSGPGLPFDGRRFTDRRELARALVERWDHAAVYLFGRGEAGEAWRTLRDWLAEVPDDSRIELVDRHLTSDTLSADGKLLHLVRWLDPQLPPHYLGRRVTPDDLPGLAALASEPGHPDHRTACLLGKGLWDGRLLDVLAGFEGAHELARVDVQWRAHVAAWNDLARWLRSQDALPLAAKARLPGTGAADAPVAGEVPPDEPPVVLLTLLALAARPAETANALRQAVAKRHGEDVPWFAWLVDGAADDDPLRLLAVARTQPEAAAEAAARQRDRRAEEIKAEELRRHRDEQEQRRLEKKNAAVTRAIGWSLPILLFWLAGSGLIAQLAGGGTKTGPAGWFVMLGFVAVLAWAVQCVAEVFVARAQGGEYLPHGPWALASSALSASGRGMNKVGQAMRGTPGKRGLVPFALVFGIMFALLLIALAAVTPAGGLLWMLAMPSAAVAHAVAAGVRLHRWRTTRNSERGTS